MSIDLNILKNFDIDNDGILNPDEKSAYDAHAEQADFTRLKDSVANLKGDVDLSKLNQINANADGQIVLDEAQNYKNSNLPQINSHNFAKHSYDINIDFANQWVDNLGKEPSQNELTYLLLVKEFGSEGLAIEIMNNAEITESEDGSIKMDFSVDGVNFSLNTSTDPQGAIGVSMSTSEDDLIVGIHNNPAFEDGISFSNEYNNEFGSRISEWSNAGGLTINGVQAQGFDENGMGFTRVHVLDANNYTQINDDGTVIHVEDGLIVSGRYSNGVEFTREHSTVDNLNYIERQSNGIFHDVRGGMVVNQGDVNQIPEEQKSITDGISQYRQENGFILGGVLDNGSEFERFNIVDNKNYSQVTSDGTSIQVVNGEVISEAENLGITDKGLRLAKLESLDDIDTSIVDPDGTKFHRMKAAFNINSSGSIDFYNSTPSDWIGSGEVDEPLKDNIVNKFLLAFGNDDEFLEAIEKNGINITIADDIFGTNPNGDQWGIGGFHTSWQDEQGRNTIVLAKEVLTGTIFIHEFAHERDDLVDGRVDGIFGDLDSNIFDNAIAVSRDRANNGAAQGLFDLDYANSNEREFLAEMMEGYYLDPMLFEERFPEFTAALGSSFDHLDQTIGLLNLNEEAVNDMFDQYRDLPTIKRFSA